uniref:Uncharacterized protein n=1 Tax=Romanomermis culicivorax TaxID=13658 RepID=A0A915JNV2_ROMCU
MADTPRPRRIYYPGERLNCMVDCPGGCARQEIIDDGFPIDLEIWAEALVGKSTYDPIRLGPWRCCENEMFCHMPDDKRAYLKPFNRD